MEKCEHDWIGYDTIFDGDGREVTIFICKKCGAENEEYEDEE